MIGKVAKKPELKFIDENPMVVSFPDLDITAGELADKIKMSGNLPGIFKSAEKTLHKARELWQPKAVYRWVGLKHTNTDLVTMRLESENISLEIDLGYSSRFLKKADYALVSVYTAGEELELQSMIASQKGDHLEGYFFDLIGLIVLDKVSTAIKDTAEKKAIESGLGVSPFLSPGSVHGWDLDEQIKLCSFLPIKTIDVSIREDAVLSPFKSISCLIGVGEDYNSGEVGTTCQICSKKHECQMKQNSE